MDENVHFSQTMKVVSALVEHNKDFDMLLVPNTDHSGVRGPYAIRRMWDCECSRLWAGRLCSDASPLADFVTHLQGAEPPVPQFEITGEGEQAVTH